MLDFGKFNFEVIMVNCVLNNFMCLEKKKIVMVSVERFNKLVTIF